MSDVGPFAFVLCVSLQCRGWGTDTAPPHMNELYRKQMELYEQTKRRESLSALSLAITTPRYVLCLDFPLRSVVSGIHVSPSIGRPPIRRRRAWTNRTRRPPRPPRLRYTGRRDLQRGSRSGPGRPRPPRSPPETRRPQARGRNQRTTASRGIESGRESPRKLLRAARTRRRSRGTGDHKVSVASNASG